MRRNVCHSAQLMLPSFYNSALYTPVEKHFTESHWIILIFWESKIKSKTVLVLTPDISESTFAKSNFTTTHYTLFTTRTYKLIVV